MARYLFVSTGSLCSQYSVWPMYRSGSSHGPASYFCAVSASRRRSIAQPTAMVTASAFHSCTFEGIRRVRATSIARVCTSATASSMSRHSTPYRASVARRYRTTSRSATSGVVSAREARVALSLLGSAALSGELSGSPAAESVARSRVFRLRALSFFLWFVFMAHGSFRRPAARVGGTPVASAAPPPMGKRSRRITGRNAPGARPAGRASLASLTPLLVNLAFSGHGFCRFFSFFRPGGVTARNHVARPHPSR